MNTDENNVKSEKSWIKLKGNRLIRITVPEFWTKKMTKSLIKSIKENIELIGQGEVIK